ncbi:MULTISPECIES: hypothetical protein [unclassified Nocardia]|uniref:hypothetical protein n=1 Tax=unclassified Nocardia TaxID=2637762 RepID=UPI001CE3BBDF|nr:MULTISPECIES: hypothetical protein [unclassified Nocardia]
MLLPDRTFRITVATAAAAVAVTVGLTACGSDDKSDSAKASSATAAPASGSAAGSGDHSATVAPTAEALQANLLLITDPNKPTADKAAAIVNGDKRTANIDKMTAGLANYPLTFAVSDIKLDGTKAAAQVGITSPHGTAPVPMTWEQSDGKWKLSDASACTIFGFAKAPCTP